MHPHSPFADYLEEHAEHVSNMLTRFLLREAAKQIRYSDIPMNNFYIKQLPNNDFVVVYED